MASTFDLRGAVKTKQILRIVLSSPGDVKEERQIMEDVIKDLNRGVAADRNLLLELSRWETDVHPGFHAEGPQGLIDPILNIEDSDILLGIFWKRFGTPTRDVQSGTEHEIRTAIKSWKRRKSPQIMIYFKETELPPFQNEEELEQYSLVLRFRKEFPEEGLYWTFEAVADFERLARNHLTIFIRSRYAINVSEVTSPKNRTHAFLRDYCRQIQQHRFSSIYLFGHRRRRDPDGRTALDHMASIEHGFVPVHLSDWHETDYREGAEPLEIEDLFFANVNELRFLVRGLPGGGKTTLLRYLGFRFAALSMQGDKEVIPVFLQLRDFQCSKRSLEEFARQTIDENSDSPEMRDVLCGQSRFLERPMVLLLDGLDEIEDAETNEKIADLLDEFARNHPRCKMIVTSRPTGLKHKDYLRFRPLDLLPLSPAMIFDYIKRWFGGNTDSFLSLQQTLNDKPRICALAANPFLLSMICYTFERGGKTDLIERRSQLLANCTLYLLERPYDQESKHHPLIDYEQALEILRDVSLRFFLWQEADFTAEHVNVIGRHNPTALLLGETEKILDQLQRETGLIQRVKEGYTFVHRSLWEYFTALAMLDKKPDFVIRQAANPDWEEVVRLYAGLLSRDEDVKKLVDGLWNINRPLALRTTTEIKVSAADIIKPLIEQEEGNQGKLLLIDSLEQSLPLVAEAERDSLVLETLRIMLLECAERDCQVIYHAQALLEKMGLKPLESGGIHHELLDLAHASVRWKELLADPDNRFEWIEVEGGTFWMGDDHNRDNERPAHQVKLGRFHMAKHPVTNRFLASFPLGQKYPNYGGDSHPAVENTWFEAYYFALWVDARLPTEAEWEYAARGGKKARSTQYFFGDDPKELENYARFGESGKETAHAVDKINPRTGKQNLNPLGLANILGNVWEWCADWYDGSYYEYSSNENPKGPERGAVRVFRGGSWSRPAQDCRSAYRNFRSPGDRRDDLGFRLARSLEP